MSLPAVASLFLAATAPASGGAATAAPKAPPAGQQITLKEPAIAPKTERACGIVTKAADPKAKPEFHQVDGLKLLGGPMKVSLPDSKVPVEAVYCKRDTVVPGAGDGRVIWQLRKALVLQDVSRQGVLELTDKGAYSFRMTLGTLSDAEKQATLQRLQILQVNLRIVRQAEAQARAKAAAASAPPSAQTAAPPPAKKK